MDTGCHLSGWPLTGHGRCACFRINFRLSERIVRMRQRSRFIPRPQEGGRHEILVDTPDHDATIDTFDAAHIASILQVLQDRLHFFPQSCRYAVCADFQKLRPSAGMSMHHSHWQVVGLPVVPKRAATMAGGYAQRGLPVLQNACLRKGNEQAYCGGNRAFSCAYALRRTLCL